MSLGLILIIILVIFLAGGFSGRFGGYGLFLSKGEFGFERGKVVFLYNFLDLKRTIWEGPELQAGKHTIVFNFKSDGPGCMLTLIHEKFFDEAARDRHNYGWTGALNKMEKMFA